MSKNLFPYQITTLAELPKKVRSPINAILPYIKRSGMNLALAKRILITGKQGSGKTREAINCIHKIKPDIVFYSIDGVQPPTSIPEDFKKYNKVVLFIDDLPRPLDYENPESARRLKSGFADVSERLEKTVSIFESNFPDCTIIVTIDPNQLKHLSKKPASRKFLETFLTITLQNLTEDESNELIDNLSLHYDIKIDFHARKMIIESNDGTLSNIIRFFDTIKRKNKDEISFNDARDFGDFLRNGWNEVYFRAPFWEQKVIDSLSMIRQCLVLPHIKIVKALTENLNEGLVWQKSDKINNAIENLSKKIINITKDNILLCYDVDLERKGNLEEHIERLARILLDLTQKKDSSEIFYSSLLNLGIKLYYSGYTELSKEIYSRILEMDPDNIEARYNYGTILQDIGNSTEAEKEFKKALELQPNDVKAHYNMAVFLHRSQRHQEAENEYKIVLQMKPDDEDTHQNYALLLHTLKRYEEAENEYRKAIEINPTDPQLHNNLGVLLKTLRKHKDAEEEYRKSLELEPDYAKAYLNLGNLFFAQGKYREAKSYYETTIKLDPMNPKNYINMGLVCTALRKYDEAEKSYRKAIEIDPKYARAYNSLGALLYGLGRLKEAEQAYLKAIELDKDLVDAHYNLTMVYEEAGEPEKSIEHWEAITKTAETG